MKYINHKSCWCKIEYEHYKLGQGQMYRVVYRGKATDVQVGCKVYIKQGRKHKEVT